ncbi:MULTISPECIES: hypothetical protein [unclassified Paenibacillus]|uniref:hypothetical protein n=1 Tax=unclassified Paenibacillus TaxID=185978 RepID=UPI002F3FF493
MNKRSSIRRMKRKSGLGKHAQRKVIPLPTQAQAAFLMQSSEADVYIGPSVEGGDKEYVKVVSGKVIERRPSFA